MKLDRIYRPGTGSSAPVRATSPRAATSTPAMNRGAPLLRSDYAALYAAATDFGHAIARIPAGVLQPKCTRDVQRVVIFAARNNTPVAFRGLGHSAYGQATVDGGIVIDSGTLNSIRWCGPTTLDVGPGATWSEVAKVALTRGLTPPVIPDTNNCLTVGGTLSVGGYGETSHALGAQVDHVVELEVVTGTGERLICSKTQHRDLFDMIRAGVGQCGLITSAKLELIPAPSSVKTVTTSCSDVPSFVQMLFDRMKAGDFAIAGHLNRTANGWQPIVETTTPDTAKTDNSYWTYVDRNNAGLLNAIKSGDLGRPHPYLSFFVSESAAVATLQRLVNDPEATLGATVLAVFPYDRAKFASPMLALPDSERGLHIRIYRKATLAHDTDHQRMLAENDKLTSEVLSAGGTMYLPFAPPLTASQVLQQFGKDRLSAFADAKRHYDPKGILNPGATIKVPALS